MGFFAAAAVATLATPAQAQFVDCASINTGLLHETINDAPFQTCTLSTNHQDINISGGTPSVVVAGNNPLQGQINQVLVGPNASALLNTLNSLGVLGSPGPATRQFLGPLGTVPVTSISEGIGPGGYPYGPDLSLIAFIPPGYVNFNVNTFTTNYFLVSSGSQPLSQRGGSWLTGDLHATVQTTLLDDGFHFVDMLLGRGRDTSSPVNMLSPTPLGFAPSQLSGGYTSGQSFPEDAFAYATKAPTAKAPSMADVGNGWSAWLAGSGTSAKFDSTANNFGFGYRSAGASGGMERRVGNWLYGGAFSISRSNVNQDATGDSAGIDTQRLGIYGAYQPAPFTVAAAMSYGHHSTDASRLTMLPGLDAQAGYQANSLNAGVDVSKTYAWQWGNVQPMAGLIYNGLWTNWDQQFKLGNCSPQGLRWRPCLSHLRDDERHGSHS
jgi:hypothetical protein